MIPARRTFPAVLGLLLLAAIGPSSAQAPDDEWRTLRTGNFRVHYPVASEDWARYAASLLGPAWDGVADEIGYRPDVVVDVLVTDPFADANGLAIPLLSNPRLVLFTTAPPPDSTIGNFADWPEMLILHENAHLVHLLRPGRRPLAKWLPVGPISLDAPRWVTEGYATYIEGRLTGVGRPNSDLRAAILRRWAQAGRLPTYGRLSRDRSRWRGGAMAYLVGSAYLEWLVDRVGEDSPAALWRRMTARKKRSFDEAFSGVFGDSPSKLYDRFVAEVTWKAMEAEQLVEPELREGKLWQDLSWSTGAPAVSPDGSRIVLVQRRRDRPSRLVVWSTGPPDKEEEKRTRAIESMLARDPEDVAPVRSRPVSRDPLHELPARNGAEPYSPRWMPDGESILFHRFEPDGRGFLHTDLFRWYPADGSVERVTRFADVRQADPAPDGQFAVAVRSRHGYSQLVRVDLGTGEVDPITEPVIGTLYDRPRLDPEGKRIVFLRHHDRRWNLVVRNIASGAEIVLPTGQATTVARPSWGPDGDHVLASLGENGFIDVKAIPADGGGPGQWLTCTHGAALAAEPTPDGEAFFFLSMEPDGFDLRRLELDPVDPPLGDLPEVGKNLAPVVPPEPDFHRPVFLTGPSIEPIHPPDLPRPYGAGRQEILPLAGLTAAPSTVQLELGLRGGDVVGRLDWIVLASVGKSTGPRGLGGAAVWRDWPVTLEGHLFATKERPSSQPDANPLLGTALDQERFGFETAAGWGRLWRTGRVGVRGGVLLGQVEPEGGARVDRRIAFAGATGSYRRSWGRWRLDAGAGLDHQSGRTGDDSWSLDGAKLSAGVRRGKRRGFRLTWQTRRVDGADHPLDLLQLGGLEHSVLPRSSQASRIVSPALPVGTAIGDRYEGWRADVWWLFYERHRVRSSGGPADTTVALAGVEWARRIGPVPLAKLPRIDVRVGIAYILDEPLDGKIRAWVGTVFRP